MSCFFDWISDPATFYVQFYLLILWIYTCWALVPCHMIYARTYKDLAIWSMQQGVKFTEVWYMMLFFTGTLIWYHTCTNTHTCEQRYTAHSGTNKLTHPYKYMLKPPVMCPQQLSRSHWMNNSLTSKMYFPKCLFFSKTTEAIYQLIRCNKTKFFLWNTNNTDRNGVNKQNTHTHTPHIQRKITLERVS